MSSQSLLPGFAEPPPLTHRLFFALFPEHDAAARIAQLARQLCDKHQLKGQPLRTERFHVTLHHLGDYAELPGDLVAIAQDAAASFTAASFEVAFDHVASFSSMPRNRPLVLRGGDQLAALEDFQRNLGSTLKRMPLGRWARPGYTPHVTLLYDDKAVAAQAIDAIGWKVSEFVLVHSLIGQSRHIPLGRWPLLMP
ncbi:MAG: 2'-5' RNA ligase family protein [Polaromonas sp.]